MLAYLVWFCWRRGANLLTRSFLCAQLILIFSNLLFNELCEIYLIPLPRFLLHYGVFRPTIAFSLWFHVPKNCSNWGAGFRCTCELLRECQFFNLTFLSLPSLLQNILLVVVSTHVFYHRRECHLYAGLPFQSLDRKTKISYWDVKRRRVLLGFDAKQAQHKLFLAA